MATSPITPPTQTNPILDEIKSHVASMSPHAQSAIHAAIPTQGISRPPDDGAVRSISPPIQDPHSSPPVPPIGAPPANPDPQGSLRPGGSAPPMPILPPSTSHVNGPPPLGSIQGQENETQRLIGSGSGVSQIQNPIGRIAAETGSAIGHIVAPGLAAEIPGTEDHNQRLIQESNAKTGILQKQQATDTTDQLRQAQTANEQAKPELAEAKGDLAQEKLNETTQHHQAQVNEQLRAHGYKTDEKGNVVPLSYEEMSPQQQAVTDLKGSQEELADATAALRKAQKDNIPAQIQMAQQRIATARQNAGTAAARLGLSRENLDFQEEKFYNPQPTQTERNKGDLANSAIHQIGVMRDVLKNIPKEFGPGGGRENQFGQWVGSSDPQAVKYRAAAQYLADHSAALFGGRGQYIMQQLHDLTSERFNPKALNAVLDEAESTSQGFKNAGTVHPKGGSSGYSKPPEGGGGQTQTFHVGNDVYNIPADKVEAFKKEFPNAK